MNDIIDYIDEQIHECFSQAKGFGICHLVEDDQNKYPAELNIDGKSVFPDDRNEINYYFRLLNAPHEPSEEMSFGRTVSTVTNQSVRLVVFREIEHDDLVFITDLVNALPDTFEIDESPNPYKMLRVSKNITVIRDSTAVWEDEYSDSYKDKYQKVWNIYAIEFVVQFIKCPVCVT